MFRQLRAVMIPVTVIGLLPWAVLRGSRADARPASVALGIAGGALALAGVALMAWTIRLFGRVGKGTLAPFDPPRRLVVVGPYAHVRNPMISGGLCILVGEAIFFASDRLAICAAAFYAINQVYFMLSEEPGLAKRFGAEYLTYRANVPRWIPRRQAWRPTA